MKRPETSNSQFDSFLYWRQPIPELDLSELEDLGLSGVKPVQKSHGKKQQSTKKPKAVAQAQDDLSEYSSFNYWREPIASIDTLDFNLFL